MLQKSREAKQYYQERGTPLPQSTQTIDELLRFANMSGVIQRTSNSGPNLINSHSPEPPTSTPTTNYANSTTAQAIRPTPLAFPLSSSSSPDELSMSIHSPLDTMGYSATPSPMVRVPMQQISSSSRRNLQPQHPLKIPTLPQMNRYNIPEHQAVADIMGQWQGLFHDVPPHPGRDHTANPNINRKMGQDTPQTGYNSEAHVSAPVQPLLIQNSSTGTGLQSHGGGPESVMQDDRWVSFMNYDLMHGEPSQYHHP
jgi:hypothetical protein